MEKKHNRPRKLVKNKDQFLHDTITKDINRY